MRPRSAARIVALGLFVLGATVALSQGSPEPPAESFDETARVRLRSVRLRIQPRQGVEPGRCHDLQVRDLEVSLPGATVDTDRLVELDRTPPPTMHLLLLDTSGSMHGRLERVRQVVEAYLAQLDPRWDKALLVTFDESVVLLEGDSSDAEALAGSIRNLRMSGDTSLNDGLYFALREASAHRERPVLVLLTDGVDTSSHYDLDDLEPLLEQRPEMALFTIGLDLPTPGTARGSMPTRRFLARSARRHNGKFFDLATGTHLGRVFDTIREMLDDEATLLFVDPDPASEPAPVRVTSKDPHCKVRVLEAAGTRPTAEEVPPSRPDGGRHPYPPPTTYLELPRRQLLRHIDPQCRGAGSEPWFIELRDGHVHGCGLDIAMESGLLYTPYDANRIEENSTLELVTRPFAFDLPDPDRLPTDPVAAMDALAVHARSVAGEFPAIDIRRRRDRDHARPFHDYPGLVNGRTFLENREALARILFEDPRYREWLERKLQREAETVLRRRIGRLQLAAPDSGTEAVEGASAADPEARGSVGDVEPTPADLQGSLAAWLGDVPAHDLFVAWERERSGRLLRGTDDVAQFVSDWVELRKIFFVPSYARVLTPLAPVYDPQLERIGFWRILLPRPGWLLHRIKGWKKDPEFGGLPLDLIPDRPFGLLALQQALERDPALAERLRGGGYHVSRIVYASLEKPYRQDPRRAFDRAEVRLVLEPDGGSPRIELEARLHLDRETGDPQYDTLRVLDDPAPSVARTAAD